MSIHEAYAAALAPSPSTIHVLSQIERSYGVQPFSKVGGLWRMSAVVRNWSEAAPRLRQFALREAVWLPASGLPTTTVDQVFENAGLGLQLDLARRLPPA